MQRVALVTGGNRGIGYAIAEELVSAGYKVAVTARSGQGPTGALTVVADVTDSGSLDLALSEVEQKLGPVEILVANAGITKDNLLLRMSEEEFEEVINTNLTGVFRLVKRVTKGMLKAKFGRIILIGSVVGLYGSAGLGSKNITANVIAPGFINTDMTAALPQDLADKYRSQIPIGRFAEAEEVAKVVAWFASEQASYISGAVIPVDGGLGMGH